MPSRDARPTTRRGRSLAVALLTIGLAAGGCTAGAPDRDTEPTEEVTTTPEPPRAVAATVDGVVTLEQSDPAGLALGASETFFDEAPLVVLAEVASAPAEGLAHTLAGPLLLTGGTVDDEAVLAEIDRLGAVGLVVVADGSAEPTGEALPAGLADRLPDTTVATVDPADLALPEGDDLTSGDLTGSDLESLATSVRDAAPDLPDAGEPRLVSDLLVLWDGAPESSAALASARAAGATPVETPGGDPRATTGTVEAVHAAGAGAVVGIGASFGSPDELAWRVGTAATGVELPGGGQLVLPGKSYVALYGSPVTPALGVLGEQGVPETIARAQRLAKQYTDLTDQPVVPTLEIIVTVASGSAGDDGNYSNEWPVETFLPLVDAAEEAGVYVVLDFQPGRTDFRTQVEEYAELVARPHVGVALDPEWRLEPDEVHLRQIGSVGIDEVNDVVDYLADLTRENDLPQKLLVLHQFRLSMITDRERLDTSRPELAVLIHADGQGGQQAKTATWEALHRDAPDGVYWGWKNFYDEDTPMLTPEQTFRVRPVPDFVSYQ
ncbi:hypothetical protein [Oerskovia flava]|uniref:hypothetical protein n=1 Tax=Oerskovia flava TaxID=2986422 RepID=UPI00223F5582|nr:hypothetical protein [Oerskovia sp. JB1-3-2]